MGNTVQLGQVQGGRGHAQDERLLSVVVRWQSGKPCSRPHGGGDERDGIRKGDDVATNGRVHLPNVARRTLRGRPFRAVKRVLPRYRERSG